MLSKPPFLSFVWKTYTWWEPKSLFSCKVWILMWISCLKTFKSDNTRKKIGPMVLGSFGMKSAGFHHEILADFMAMKSGQFHGHEIWQISWWNPADFMKSSEFHEIQWISCMKFGVFHEIRQISCMKFGRFHEIWRISSMKSGRFHGWSWKMQTWKCKIFMMHITFLLHKLNQQFFDYG